MPAFGALSAEKASSSQVPGRCQVRLLIVTVASVVSLVPGSGHTASSTCKRNTDWTLQAAVRVMQTWQSASKISSG